MLGSGVCQFLRVHGFSSASLSLPRSRARTLSVSVIFLHPGGNQASRWSWLLTSLYISLALLLLQVMRGVRDPSATMAPPMFVGLVEERENGRPGMGGWVCLCVYVSGSRYSLPP